MAAWPKKIKVLSKYYDFKLKKPPVAGCVGITMFDEMKIYAVPNKSKIETIIHELIHVVEDELNLELTEERVVELENFFSTLFVDNLDLLQKMIECKKKEQGKRNGRSR